MPRMTLRRFPRLAAHLVAVVLGLALAATASVSAAASVAATEEAQRRGAVAPAERVAVATEPPAGRGRDHGIPSVSPPPSPMMQRKQRLSARPVISRPQVGHGCSAGPGETVPISASAVSAASAPSF